MIAIKPLFHLGDIHIAEGVVKLADGNVDRIFELLEFHQQGCWGNIPKPDKELNRRHLRIKKPLLSCYNLCGSKVFIVTDLAANVTWMMRKNDILKDELNGFTRSRPRNAS